MKHCSRCDTTLPLDSFTRSRNRKDGRHPYCRTCRAAYAKARPVDPAEAWRQYLWNTYHLSPEDYSTLLDMQGGGCAICGGPPAPPANGVHGGYSVDHDHRCCPGRQSCGQCVRGLLCTGCNTGIGLLREDAAIMASAIDYVETGGTRRVQEHRQAEAQPRHHPSAS